MSNETLERRAQKRMQIERDSSSCTKMLVFGVTIENEERRKEEKKKGSSSSSQNKKTKT